MALRLVRAGNHGRHEQRFLDEGRIYVTHQGPEGPDKGADIPPPRPGSDEFSTSHACTCRSSPATARWIAPPSTSSSA